MRLTALPIIAGARVISIDSGDFRALVVSAATDRYVVAAGPEPGDECAAPIGRFLAVPEDWVDPPAADISELRAVEASYSGPIPAAAIAAAEARDAALPALTRRLDATEAWLAWVRAQLHPLSPELFEPHLLAAQASREAALQAWLRAASPREILAAE